MHIGLTQLLIALSNYHLAKNPLIDSIILELNLIIREIETISQIYYNI